MTRSLEDIVSDILEAAERIGSLVAHKYHQLDLELMWTNMSVSVPALATALSGRSDQPQNPTTEHP